MLSLDVSSEKMHGFYTIDILPSLESGQVYGWGGNSYSQVGLASSSSVQVPTLVGGALSGKTVTKIACGGNHSLALVSSGEASRR